MFSLSKRQVVSSARQTCGRGVSPRVRLAGVMMCGALTALLTLPAGAAPAAPPTTATTTTLAVVAGGNAVTTVAAGTVVALTATVTAGTSSVRPAQVAFCDATATSCTGPHLLGIAQVTGSGTAIYRFVPGVGAHSYRAVFLGISGGTTTYGASASATTALMVTGTIATTTTIAQSGTAPNITLKATTVGAGPYPAQNPTQSVTINLGQSAQNYVLTGTGPSSGNGGTYGNYYNTQGSCVTSGATTTCDLTGSFTSSTAGYASGTYDFQTVFTGSITTSITSQTVYPVGSQEPNPFTYSAFAPSLTMALKLIVDGGGAYTIPVAENANFDPNLDLVNFADVAPACAGLPQGDACQEDTVGTVPGATYTGLVTGVVEFEMPVPPTLVGPTGTVSFEDTSNANAVLGTAALGAATPHFVASLSSAGLVTVGGGPYGQANGDFNGDGLLDLAVANFFDGTLSVLLGNGDGTFKPPATYTVGTRPEQVMIADLNADGFPDLIVANTNSNTVSVLLGKGDGTFQAQVTYQCASPASLGVMDINHDGYPDVVAGDFNGSTMTVLLGKGDGTLQAGVTYASGSNPESLAEGDFNGDGNVDVVVGNAGGGTVGIFLGKGDGTFQPMVTYAVGGEPIGVQVGDFNRDGKQDLVVSNRLDSTIGVLLGNGDGTFQTQVTYATGTNPVAVVIGDFNGDGFLDVSYNINGGNADTQGVLLGNGDGTFQAELAFATGTHPDGGPMGDSVGDFNGDGLPDISVSNTAQVTVSVLLSQLTQTAVATATGVAPAAGTHQVVASYPGDGNFATSVSQPTAVMVGSGQTTPVITWAMPAAITTTTPLSGTQLDATAATANGTAIPGTFVYTPAAGTMLAAGTQTLSVTFTPTDTADFTAATKTTTIVVTQAAPVAGASTTTLAITPVTGAQGVVFTLTATVVSGGQPVAGGEVNFLDGGKVVASAELVSATGVATYKTRSFTVGSHALTAMFTGTSAAAASATTAAVTLNVTGKYGTTTALTSTGVQGSYVLTGTVDGLGLGSPTGNVVFTDTSTNATLGTVPVSGVVPGFVPGTPISAGSAAAQVVSADVNGDGKLDLVVANSSGAMVTVLLGNGDGTYTAMAPFGTNYTGITGVAVADFNGDGKLDVATANQSTVGIFLGNGDGTFGAEHDFANTNTSAGVFAGDFNGDGKLDLAVPDRYNGMTILIGNGDGTFTQPNPAFNVGASPNYHSAIADFNGDGKLDIAAGNFFDNTVSILIGNGDGTFQPPVTYATGSAPTTTFAGDFNGDGITDIFLSNSNDGTISVLLGNGDGTFKPQQTYAVGANPNDASVGDLNGDGKLDIAVANVNDGTVSILFGNGDGTFQPQQVLVSGSGTESVTIGDANGDGSRDVEAVNTGGNTVTVFLNEATAAVSLTGVTLPGTGTDNVVATYGGDTSFTGSRSNTLALPSNVTAMAAVISWKPAVGTIAYGTALGAQQLNATAATAAGVAIPGTFVYTPAAGAVLAAGTQTLSVTFTPTSAAYAAATGTTTILVTKATPVISWAAPAMIAYGTPLSATQLDATVSGVAAGSGAGALAGTLVYTPPAGTMLMPGTQTLSVAFAPTDAVDYTGATASVNIVVGGLGLSGIAPLGAVLGSANTTITLTGTGFVPTSVVLAGTNRLATKYVNGTTLTAVVPATLLGATGSLAITVSDPAIAAVSAAQTFTVLPVVPAATLTGPATTAPGTQPTVGLTITNPYPLALTAQFTLTFASAGSTPVDDPSIQFSTGGRVYSYAVAANSTSVPPVQLQAGTDAGTITIAATLMADGVDVTPTGLAPLVIVVPPVVPVISGTTITASGNTLTVVVHGFSNTREVSQAVFDFTAATGDTVATPSLTIPATTIFTTWYSDSTSDAYGSTFTYTQIFTTSGDAKTVGTVKVTLTNSVGVSAVSTSAGTGP